MKTKNSLALLYFRIKQFSVYLKRPWTISYMISENWRVIQNIHLIFHLFSCK